MFEKKSKVMYTRNIISEYGCKDEGWMMSREDRTMAFAPVREESSEQILLQVYQALDKKGYDPINQLVGYIISGDPTYITSYQNARSLICRFERDELLEEVMRFYIKKKLG